jgi:hypothetical protein
MNFGRYIQTIAQVQLTPCGMLFLSPAFVFSQAITLSLMSGQMSSRDVDIKRLWSLTHLKVQVQTVPPSTSNKPVFFHFALFFFFIWEIRNKPPIVIFTPSTSFHHRGARL